jgi:Rho termination factor, N-terminal domain
MSLQPEFQINSQFASRYYFPRAGKIFIKAGTPVARLYFPAGYDFTNKLNFDRSQVKMVYDSWSQAPKSRKSRVVEFVAPSDVLLAIAAQCSESNFDRNRELTRKLLASLKQAVKSTPTPAPKVVVETPVAVEPVIEKAVEIVEMSPRLKAKVKQFNSLCSLVAHLGLSVESGNKSGVWHLVNESGVRYFAGTVGEIKYWVQLITEFPDTFPELFSCPVSFPVVQEVVVQGVSDIPEIDQTALHLHQLTIKQLKSVCYEVGIKGYSKLRKKELIEFTIANIDRPELTLLVSGMFGINI